MNVLPNTINFLRTGIASFNKQFVKDIANTFNGKVTSLTSRFKYIRNYLAVFCAIKS